eukprot:CAMPEP_0170598590 /NCGR_PEP_ID=MMETSP0224-20130122/16332_1 /TAXON_ID=285029 /ORGANISM="Togula jolla, Strain CCCM 725" /LENGTH=116 /DNA_ID=CAMNT_0010923159 /DNA_START=1437 /DNA_END=1783 /DNA_ORIENTATION=-
MRHSSHEAVECIDMSLIDPATQVDYPLYALSQALLKLLSPLASRSSTWRATWRASWRASPPWRQSMLQHWSRQARFFTPQCNPAQTCEELCTADAASQGSALNRGVPFGRPPLDCT